MWGANVALNLTDSIPKTFTVPPPPHTHTLQSIFIAVMVMSSLYVSEVLHLKQLATSAADLQSNTEINRAWVAFMGFAVLSAVDIILIFVLGDDSGTYSNHGSNTESLLAAADANI